MILVDTSIWVDHLRSSDAHLIELLNSGAVLSHSWVAGELALGNLSSREQVLELMQHMPQASVASDEEVLRLISSESLHGRGIGYVDAQLLASTRITVDAKLWTRDKRLRSLGTQLDITYDGP